MPAKLTDLSTDVFFAENTVNVVPQILDPEISFTDPDGDFDGGTLTVSGLLAEDVVSVANSGTGAGQIGLSGAEVSFEGTVIGTLAGGNGTDLTIAFNAEATSASIDALIQNLTYSNTSDTPTSSRDLTIDIAYNGVADPAPGTMATFSLLTGTANPLNGIDIGSRSTPAFVDLDGDGDLDMVVGTSTGTFEAFANDGTGGFTHLAGGANPFAGIDVGSYSAPSFVDLDGDGDLDLVAGRNDGLLDSYENDGAGGYTLLTGTDNPFAGFDTGIYSAPAFVDLDGDGDLDMVAGGGQGSLSCFDNDGTGGFTQLDNAQNPLSGIQFSAYSAPSFVDLDGDGDLDMVVGAQFGALRSFVNDGAGGYTELTGSANPFNGVDVGNISTPSFVDIDGDGDLDMVVGEGSGTLLTYQNTTAPGVVAPVTVTGTITVEVIAKNDAPTLTGLSATIDLAQGDVAAAPQLLDADVDFSDPDGTFAGGSLTVTGLLPEDVVSVRDQGTGAGQIGVTGADVSFEGTVIGTLAGGDGTTLAIAFNADATAAAIDALIQNLTYANTAPVPTGSRDLTLDVTDASGAGIGPALVASYTELAGSDNPFDGVDIGGRSNADFGDLDGDGDLDMVVGTATGTLLAFDNDGAGGFTELTGTDNPLDGIDVGGNSSPVLVDLDGDGALDLVVGNDAGPLRVFRNDGAGGFTEMIGIENPLDGVALPPDAIPVFADLDGDGDLDMAVSLSDGTMTAFERGGTGGFTEMTGTYNPFQGVSLGAGGIPDLADLDGDGDLDMVVGGIDGTLRILENDGVGGFVELTGTDNPFDGIDTGGDSAPDFVDIDGDGDLDLVVGGTAGTLAVFENTTPRGQTITVTITPQGEGNPTVVTGIPAQATVAEDTATGIDLSAVRISDADGPDTVIVLRIDASAGSLDATAAGGVQVLQSGGATLELSGTAADLEAYLADPDRVLYSGAQDAFGIGAATLTVTTADGAEQPVVGQITIDITEVTDVRIGTNGIDNITGDAGCDHIIGRGEADRLVGLDGDDIIDGGGGGDVIRGGAGADTLIGGAGGDTVQYTGSSAGVTVDLTVDMNGFQSGSGGDAEGDILSGFERVSGSSHDDILIGSEARNSLIGMDGNDEISGGAGRDFIRGGAGADILSGGDDVDWVQYSFSDTGVMVDLRADINGFQSASGGDADGDTLSGFENILGSSHDDVLIGNEGRNAMRGGEGADTFVFNTALGGGNIDKIIDFTVGEDIIHLDSAIFVGLAVGALDPAAFHSNDTGLAEDPAHRIIYETDTGRLFIDADGNGGEPAIRFATLTSSPSVDASDFLVI